MGKLSPMRERLGEDFTPNPVKVLESMRNLGYSIEEAISDLIDNSISAGARLIYYEFHWNDGSPVFRLVDDGKGMAVINGELANSFRLGAMNPLDERSPDDLGRFGCGMKTASLSQARCLKVVTKVKGGEVNCRALDLDFIAKVDSWTLSVIDIEDIQEEVGLLSEFESGTIIQWENWDRAPTSQEDFYGLVEMINNYLALCFHRFIEKGVRLRCHDVEIKPISPIPEESIIDPYSEEVLSSNNQAVLRSYLMKHPKSWSEAGEAYAPTSSFNSVELFKGFDGQQGIYIYRCDRLLTPHAGWLGLLRKGTTSKLARVTINYPNTADSEWSLDITKTKATAPFEFKKKIKEFVEIARDGSGRKFTKPNRRAPLSPTDKGNIWFNQKDNSIDAYRYRINKDHPVFAGLAARNRIKSHDLNLILDIVADNIPVNEIIRNNERNPGMTDRMATVVELTEEQMAVAKELFEAEAKKSTAAAALDLVLSLEPFCNHKEALENYLI